MRQISQSSLGQSHVLSGSLCWSMQVAGFVGLGFPEYLVKAVRHRYDSSQHPKNLHVLAVAACGDGKGRGLDELAVEGLISTATFGWAGLSPKLLKMITAKEVNAWNLPLGVGGASAVQSPAPAWLQPASCIVCKFKPMHPWP